jgi:hypothetical protein
VVLGDLAEIVLDARPLSRLPGRLEAVADPVDRIEYVHRQVGARGDRLVAHG